MAIKAEKAASKRDIKELYCITKLLAKKKFKSKIPIMNKEGLFVTARQGHL
jgi:hypothetical protein